MTTFIEHEVAQFLETRWNPARGVLLGLSGGPDSLSLLYLLLPFVKERGMRLHLAHVDHGWRPQSAAEATQLAALADQLGLPFHTMRLSDAQRQSNLEASGRQARLRFFAQLCDQYDCQAVMLGHQADDMVETTLKRVLEGVTLSYLNGLQPVVAIDRLVLWRPLLTVRKQQLVAWLRDRGLQGFEDVTNHDPRFLRGRMRTQMLPTLERQFGKEGHRRGVHQGLRRIADEAQELRQYLDGRVAPWLQDVPVGPMGHLLSLTDHLPSGYELRYLVRRVVEQAGLFLSRQILEFLVRALEENAADKRAVMGQHTLIVDRRRLFVWRRPLALPEAPVDLHTGVTRWGPWEIAVSASNTGEPSQTGWRHAWMGAASLWLPPGDYQVGRPLPSARVAIPRGDTCLTRWWSNHKIPAFLRYQVPVICNGPLVCAEFLSEPPSRYCAGKETGALRVSCRLLANDHCDTIPQETSNSPDPSAP